MRLWRNPVTGKFDLILKSIAELSTKDHDLLDGLTDDDHTQYVLRNQWLQNGFPDASEVSLSWDDASMTLTIQPSGANFNYILDGILYTETGSLTETIADTEGFWAFYINAEGLITSVLNPSHSQIDGIFEDEILVAYVYWDATNNDGRLMQELHGSNMAPSTHHWIHDNIGSSYKSGMALADFVIDDSGDDDEDAQFSVASGEFHDEDILNALSAITKTTGLEIWYLVGSDWRWTTNSGFSVLTTGSGRLAFNDNGSQTEVDNNDFVLCHILATNISADDGTSPKYIAIQGQAEYNTVRLARSGADTEINSLVFGTLPVQEVVPVGTIIFQTSNGYANAVQARTRTTDAGDNYVDWRASSIKASGGSIADHGALAGLADDDHSQYLLIDGSRAMTGDLLVDGGQIGITADPDLISMANGALTINGTVAVEDTDIGSSAIRINAGGSGNRVASFDLVGDDTYSEACRFVRVADGPNALTQLAHRGLGSLLIVAVDAGWEILATSNIGRLYINPAGNFGFNSAVWGTNAVNVLAIGQSTAPTSSPADITQLWTEDVGGAGQAELRVRDELGNVTTLSPHNFELFEPDPSYEYPWSYRAENPYIGKVINVDMYGAIKEIEAFSGKQFIYTKDIPKTVPYDEKRNHWKEKWIKDNTIELPNIPEEVPLLELEITKADAIEYTDIEVDDRDNVIGEEITYELIEDEVKEKRKPKYAKKIISRGKTKDGVRFSEITGKFYKEKVPTEQEAEDAAKSQFKLELPDWIKDRI